MGDSINNADLKQLLLELREENERLKRQNSEKTLELRGKQETIDRSDNMLGQFDQKMKEFVGVIESHDCQKNIYKETLIKYLIDLEDKTRKEKRIWLNEQAIRLGRLTTQRSGTKFVEGWEEGEAFKKLKQKLGEIMYEKDEIDKLKKNRNKNKQLKKLPSVPSLPFDAFNNGGNGGTGLSRQVSTTSINTNQFVGLNETSEFDLEESEFNNIDKNEQKEIY